MNPAEPVGARASLWGEGPVWWRGRLAYVDIEGHALVFLDPDDGREEILPLDQRIGFALPADDDSWIWGGDHGLYCLRPDTGRSEPMVDPEPDLPHNRFNDAGVSPDGRLFAGTIATDKTEGAATLYRLEPDGALSPVVSRVTNSNGIGWSPDGTLLYYIDTPTRAIRRYPYHHGALGEPDILTDTDPVIDASPDGLCVDAEGHLWVAFCHGGRVIRFHRETGEALDHIDVPARETTSCAFGGPDLRDLFITTGRGAETRTDDGRVYRVRDLPVPGLPQTAVRRG